MRLQDYRDVDGEYDAIVSVEMIEAVGEEFWPSYFSTIDRLLAPGGKVAIQAITMAHNRMLETRNSYGWIQKYIFPGGLIPSIQAIEDVCGEHTSLHITQRRELGVHYAETLRRWRLQFVAPVGRGCQAGLRRELPPYLGVLPRLLRGRLPLALPRGQPDPAGAQRLVAGGTVDPLAQQVGVAVVAGVLGDHLHHHPA